MSRKLTLSACLFVAAAAWVAVEPARVEAKPPTDVPGAEPYLSMTTLGPYHGTVDGSSAVPIPADRRLVIEFVDARTTVPIGETPMITVYGRTSALSAPIILPLTLAQTSSIYDDYRSSQMVRLYYEGDGLHGPYFTCGSTGGSSISYCTVTISGYLIGK